MNHDPFLPWRPMLACTCSLAMNGRDDLINYNTKEGKKVLSFECAPVFNNKKSKTTYQLLRIEDGRTLHIVGRTPFFLAPKSEHRTTFISGTQLLLPTIVLNLSTTTIIITPRQSINIS